MFDTNDRITNQVALQEEMSLQYEALVEEMNQAPKERRFEYFQQLCDHLRRLSKATRSTALDIKFGNRYS